MEELVTEFGDAAGMRLLNGEPEHLVEQMTKLIKDEATASERFEKLVEGAQNATLPIGFVAGVRGLGYASVLVQRALGVLLSGSSMTMSTHLRSRLRSPRSASQLW